jgi:hypothetical protein
VCCPRRSHQLVVYSPFSTITPSAGNWPPPPPPPPPTNPFEYTYGTV